MPTDNFSNVIRLCAERVKEAEADAYEARSDAIDTIIDGADLGDVLSLLSWFLGGVLADICEEHRAEVRKEMVDMIDSAMVEHERMYAEIEAEGANGETKH